MKVTYQWLKDFVEIKILPQALAEKLTMAGLEVTSLEEKHGDSVFEIEITSNRPDWLSVIGVAREVAAITNKKMKLPKLKSLRPSAKSGQFSLTVEDKKDCPLYSAKIIRGVKVAPSPDWLKKRLELVGCRSVNNVVDITNYILFEYGEPLHAFDLDKLNNGAIIVRRAKHTEKITTIDAGQRALNPNLLVIADKEKPVAIAGIMGGRDTEVTEGTKNILLEAAIFNPVLIRRARQALGLTSESAYRFERGVSPGIVEEAAARAVELIQELCAGEFTLAKSSTVPKAKRKSIDLNVSSVEKILGVSISPQKIKRILESLGFKTKMRPKNKFLVEVPAHRQDVDLEIDLIEEIARISGYENIPTTIPAVRPNPAVDEKREIATLIKNTLAGLGLNEAITYSLINRGLLKNFGAEAAAIEILNPVSEEQEILRPTLIPSLLRCVAYNLNQKIDYINIFEVAKAFGGPASDPKEELVLGIALSGEKALYLEQGLVREELGLLHLKGVIERLFERLGVKDYDFAPSGSKISIYAGKENVGWMLAPQRSTLEKLEIKNREVAACELVLERLFKYIDLKKKFIPLPKYPAITRDISFILKEDVLIKDLVKAIQEKAGPLLFSVEVADYYRGKQIPVGYKGLTLSCIYRAPERTLTEAEINPLHTSVCNILTEQFGAKIR